MNPLQQLLSNHSISSSTRVIASDENSISTGGLTSTWSIGRLFQGVERYFSRGIQQRNRDGIDAYLNELGKVSPSLQHAAASELENRRATGQPLTIRKIREVGGTVLAARVLRDTQHVLGEIKDSETTPGREPLPSEVEASVENALSQLKLVQAHLRGGKHREQLNQVNSRINYLQSFLRVPNSPGTAEAGRESLPQFGDVAARTPGYVRASEFGRYNPFFINTSDKSALQDFGCLMPIDGVTWLWAVNERNEVVIGAEVKDLTAGRNLLEAYSIDNENLTDDQVREMTMMGHPSVVGPGDAGREEGFLEARLDGVLERRMGSHSKYKITGETLRKEYGKGKYGGEILCHPATGEWYLNSASGRFGGAVRDVQGHRLDEAARLADISAYLGRLLKQPVGYQTQGGQPVLPSNHPAPVAEVHPPAPATQPDPPETFNGSPITMV
jgi:hypothetical protein